MAAAREKTYIRLGVSASGGEFLVITEDIVTRA
jgi:hypothetical protein